MNQKKMSFKHFYFKGWFQRSKHPIWNFISPDWQGFTDQVNLKALFIFSVFKSNYTHSTDKYLTTTILFPITFHDFLYRHTIKDMLYKTNCTSTRLNSIFNCSIYLIWSSLKISSLSLFNTIMAIFLSFHIDMVNTRLSHFHSHIYLFIWCQFKFLDSLFMTFLVL